MQCEPYLMFNGRCEEAVEFYKKAVGAEVTMLMRFKDAPQQGPGPVPPGMDDKIMHAGLRIGNNTVMASDGQCRGAMKFDGFSLSLSPSTPEQAQRLFAALGDGGTVGMPLTKTFFSPAFGMVNDRFGLSWMIMVPQ